jgi:hypothetical protein
MFLTVSVRRLLLLAALSCILGPEAGYADILFVIFCPFRHITCLLFTCSLIRYFSLPVRWYITNEIVAPSPKLRSDQKDFEDIGMRSTLVKEKC